MSSLKTCWICFSSETDDQQSLNQSSKIASSTSTSPKVWVQPCLCKGDTRWVHESCLLSYLIRKQLSSQHDGSAQRIQVVAKEGDGDNDALQEFIKCPQCREPYRVIVKDKQSIHLLTYLKRQFMNCVDTLLLIEEYSVPAVCSVAVAYVVLVSSVTYGVYAVTFTCGPGDLMTDALLKQPAWGWKTWCGLALSPLYVIFMQSSLPLMSPLSSFIPSALAYYALCYAKLTSRGPMLNFSTLTATTKLFHERFLQIVGLMAVRRVYNYIYTRYMVPLIVGTSLHLPSLSRTRRSVARDTVDDIINQWQQEAVDEAVQADDQDQNLIVEQPVDNDNQDREVRVHLTGFDILRSVVYSWLFPVYASVSGSLVQSGVGSLLKPENIARFGMAQGTLWSLRRFTGKFDTFTWNLIGVCSIALFKDLALLAYRRQKRKQWLNMHILDSPSHLL